MAMILLLYNILMHETLRLYMLLSVMFAEKP